MTVEFGENGHFAANLAPETMWIDFFFFLTGSSDVNSDSSDAHSASVAMSLTARFFDIQMSANLCKFVLSFVSSISLKNRMPVIHFASERVFNSATFMPMLIPFENL